MQNVSVPPADPATSTTESPPHSHDTEIRELREALATMEVRQKETNANYQTRIQTLEAQVALHNQTI